MLLLMDNSWVHPSMFGQHQSFILIESSSRSLVVFTTIIPKRRFHRAIMSITILLISINLWIISTLLHTSIMESGGTFSNMWEVMNKAVLYAACGRSVSMKRRRLGYHWKHKT